MAGAVVNEMPPTDATAIAPVPTTRATPENMATTRFGFTALTVISQASRQGQLGPKSGQSWLLTQGVVTLETSDAIAKQDPWIRAPSHESMERRLMSRWADLNGIGITHGAGQGPTAADPPELTGGAAAT